MKKQYYNGVFKIFFILVCIIIFMANLNTKIVKADLKENSSFWVSKNDLKGTTGLNIKRINSKKIKIDLSYVNGYNYTNQFIATCKLKNGRADFKYIDGWSNEGKGTIWVKKETIYVKWEITKAINDDIRNLSGSGIKVKYKPYKEKQYYFFGIYNKSKKGSKKNGKITYISLKGNVLKVKGYLKKDYESANYNYILCKKKTYKLKVTKKTSYASAGMTSCAFTDKAEIKDYLKNYKKYKGTEIRISMKKGKVTEILVNYVTSKEREEFYRNEW